MNKKDSLNLQKNIYSRIGKLITSSLDLEEILQGIMLEIELYFNPDHWSIFKYHERSQTLSFWIIQGTPIDKVKDILIAKGEGIAGNVVVTGEPIFVPDTEKNKHFTTFKKTSNKR